MSNQPLANGLQTPWSTWGDYNNLQFAIQSLINKVQTATLVEVMACTNDGGLSLAGTVDIRPLVNQIDGSVPPNATPHGVIYGVPYLRVQGGSSAIILDPVKGDIGMAVFASRDISKVVSTKVQANPGSWRKYDWSDAMYVGGLLNGIPQQYLQFLSTGINIVSPNTVTITAPTIALDGAVTMSQGLTVTGAVVMDQTLTVSGDVTATGTSLHTHLHTSEAAGTPTSPPL